MNIQQYLEKGDLLQVHNLYFNENQHINIIEEFTKSCLNGFFLQSKWLYDLSIVESIKKKLKMKNNSKKIKLSQLNAIFLVICEEHSGSKTANLVDWFLETGITVAKTGFKIALNAGNLNTAYRILKHNPNIITSKDVTKLFEESCLSENLSLSKKIYNICKQHIDIKLKLLKNLCDCRQYEILKWILHKVPNDVPEFIFNYCYKIKYCLIAQYIYQNFEITAADLRVVRVFSCCDDLDVVKEIYKTFKKCFVRHKNTYLENSSNLKNFEIVKWLLNTFKYTNKIVKRTYLMTSVDCDRDIILYFIEKFKFNSEVQILSLFNMCVSKNNAVAKWFMNNNFKKMLMDDSDLLDMIFEISCRYQNVGLSRWLVNKFKIYYVKVEGRIITNFGRKSLEDYALEDVDRGNVKGALKRLGIGRSELPGEECLICRDVGENMLRLGCGHFGCLRCLLTWFTQKNDDYPAHPIDYIDEYEDENGDIVMMHNLDLDDLDIIKMRMLGVGDKEVKCTYCQKVVEWRDASIIGCS